jgi:hypothetical protein
VGSADIPGSSIQTVMVCRFNQNHNDYMLDSPVISSDGGKQVSRQVKSSHEGYTWRTFLEFKLTGTLFSGTRCVLNLVAVPQFSGQ